MQNPTDNRRALGLLGWLTLAALAAPACRGDVSHSPPVHLNPNMDNVTRIDPQEPSDFWADGRGMRPAIEGTVAQGELRVDAHLYEGRAPGGRWATDLPEGMALDGSLLERGQARFDIYCTPCHGEAGLENGGIVPRRGADAGDWTWAVSSLHGETPRGYPIGRLYDIVTNGIRTMPAYGSLVPVRDRWAIATYVRALQVSYEMPIAQIPNEIASQQGWR